MRNRLDNFNEMITNKGVEEILEYFFNKSGLNIAFASSLGAEDQVLTDMILKINENANIFTLDTGRLPKETYDLIERVNTKYKTKIQIYFPDTQSVEKLVNEKGMFSFYESINNRKECCFVRKIEPLKRALTGLDIWVTGLRREQSVTREDMQMLEWDENNDLLKLNPLIDWTLEDVWNYIKKNNVPYNRLHDEGYPSIGCAPCSRAIKDGDDIRSGRWWWENPEHKECGLHIKG